MTEPTIEMLKQLQRAAEEACARAYEQKHEIDGAINWADLHCAEAGYYRTSNGQDGVYVLIEEADPIQDAFVLFIQTELYAAGWGEIEVRTEW